MNSMNLKKKALTIFDFFANKMTEEVLLYYDKDFKEYYIIINDDEYNSEDFKKILNRYVRNFDISNMRLLTSKYIITCDDLEFVKSNKNHTNINISIQAKKQKTTHYVYGDSS